jgi:hypothetical protein
MFHKLNILVLLVFLLYPMSALKADTNTFPTIAMINPVEGSIIEVFSDTPGGNVGVDIKVAKGTKVKAAAQGTIAQIAKSRVDETFVVLLRHENNMYTVYSKLNDVNVKENDLVKSADTIGTIGSGNPPFLHFEVRHGTKPIDPAQFLTFQKADEGVLNYLMAIKGVCSKLLVNGEVFPCKNSLIHTEYQDGRIGFYFLEEGGSGKVLTFSGSGLKQKKLSENVRIQPVDGVIQKDGILNVSGECYFENPYVGEANIKCVAADANGMPFEGHFLTDGSEPEIKDFTQFSNEPLQKDNKTKIDLIKTVPIGNQPNLRRIFGNYQRECTAQQDTDNDEKLELEADNLKQIKLLQGNTEMTVLTASFYCPGVGGIWSGSGGSPVYYIIDEFVYETFGGSPYPADITENKTILINWHGGARCKTTDGQSYPNSAPCFSAIYWNNELNTFSIME